MLKFWIFISNLFVATLGTDVLFSVSKSCFSSGEDMELSAEYTGSGTVSAVQWYYSGQVNTGNNLVVRASTCTIFGTADAGYPDVSRMTFTCPPATSKFTLTLTGLQSDEFGKVWGATFSLSAGSSPAVQQESIKVCESTTTSTTSTSTLPPTTTPTPPSASSTTPTSTTNKSPDIVIIVPSVVGGAAAIVILISIIVCLRLRRKTNRNKNNKNVPDTNNTYMSSF